MNWTPRRKRFALILGGLMVLAAAAAFVLNAFQSNLVFFFTPSQVLKGEAPVNKTFRIGGMVKTGSLQRDGTEVRFVVTDTAQDITVRYTGLLPDLFKEGKGVVAQGKINEQGVMMAAEVLAKHDENYMPPAAKARAAQSAQP
jgi:cytochrome c-type biogenesis protein CcmE